MEKMKCNYCDAEREEIVFAIGATLPDNPDKDWTMHEGTGEISCPKCHETGLKHAQEAKKAATPKLQQSQCLKCGHNWDALGKCPKCDSPHQMRTYQVNYD